MAYNIRHHIKKTALLAIAAAILAIFTSCAPKSDFEIGGNDKTISVYNMQSSFSMKLTGDQSEGFIAHINESDLRRMRYKKAQAMDFNDLECVFLNHDSVLYSVRRDAGDENSFYIMTYDDDMQPTFSSRRAYRFQSVVLAQYISELEAAAKLPEGYHGEIEAVTADNSDIMLTSEDGAYQFDMRGTWEFKEITSTGSDHPDAGALDYTAYTSVWGSAISLYTGGSGITIDAYDSGAQVYDTISWSFIVEGGRRTGVIYGNSSAKYILKFIGYNGANPLFEMIDASGADDEYGAEFVRMAELTQYSEASDFEVHTGVELHSVHEIVTAYKNDEQTIDAAGDILKVVTGIKEAQLIDADQYEMSERAYSFTLKNSRSDIVTITTEQDSDYIEVGGICYMVRNPEVFSQTKETVESYIDFNALPRGTQLKNLIAEFTYEQAADAQAWWSDYPTERDRVACFNNGTLQKNWGPQSAELSEEDIKYVADRLENTEFDILEEQPVANTDCAIRIEYEDGTIVHLSASDSEVYLSVRKDSGWTYAKVRDIDLFEYVLSFADEGGIGLDMLSAAESISIHYVTEAERKDYPENGSITEIEVTDPETVSEIAKAAAYNASPIVTYPSRENADIIFHTAGGDYYAKIKFPISTDENAMSEPTLIVQGHYWYSCPELYEILAGLEQ